MAIVVAIPEHRSIGIVLEVGLNPNGSYWYRTDADGIREKHELFRIDNYAFIDGLLDQGYQIAPSTLKAIHELTILN
jgi:hypothetical protein